MCGIVGYLNLKNKNFNLDKDLLIKMQKSIFHRGPDSFGFWLSEKYQIGFAHSRLSIVDLSDAGHQPMQDTKESVVISFNGEIYNHLQLRKELEDLGYKYFSNTDTETIIYAYQEWGIDFLHKLDGMFAIALFDIQKNHFYLIRDRIGIKPVYYSLQADIFSFASEIKALWQLPWMRKKIDKESVYDCLTFMVTPAPNTIFEKVHKLESGTYISINCDKKLEIKRWYSFLNKDNEENKNWILKPSLCIKLRRARQVQDDKEGKKNKLDLEHDLSRGYYKFGVQDDKKSFMSTRHPEFISGSSNNGSLFKGEEFILNKIEDLLIKSVEKRMMADVPVGVFLSGGLDSSLITALMSKFSSKIKTFTVAFKDGPESNELEWARRVSKLFNTDHHEILISEKEAFQFYEQMVYQLDEPLADPVCIPFHFVSKLAKDNGIKVVQVGEGADELFFGYSTYLSYKKFYERYWKYSQKYVPAFFKKSIYEFSEKLIKSKSNHVEILRNWSQNRALFWSGAISFNEYQKSFICNEKNQDSYKIVEKYLFDLEPSDDFIKQMTYLELKLRLPELLLMRADKMSMLSGIETRVPFLDYKLVEFMLNVPQDLKVKNNQTKYLLKKVAEKYLPNEIIYRKKVGFASPIERWFEHGKYFSKYYAGLVENVTTNDHMFKPAIKNLESVYDHHKPGFAVQKWTLQNILALKSLRQN
ncbi:MAG: asparagine synthase (glutamine-hydrolyzing) [bacterium]